LMMMNLTPLGKFHLPEDYNDDAYHAQRERPQL